MALSNKLKMIINKEDNMENKPICYVPGRKIPEIYSGVPTFLGLPKINNEDEIKKYDVVIMGAPWEGIVTWGKFSGCEMSPKTIRDASIRYGAYLPELDMDAFDYISGGDFGDAPLYNGKYKETFKMIGNKFQKIISNNAIPITFGGDHSITYPIIKKLSAKYNGKIGIIHLDSHMDNMISFGREKYARCSPFHRIYEIEGIKPEKIVHLGIRGPRNNPSSVKEAKKYGAKVISSFEIKSKGIKKITDEVLNIVKNDTGAVYVSVCSDILDVAFNPGGPPDFCGLSSSELAMLLFNFASEVIEGFDFVEIYPPSDRGNVSSHVASWMTIYVLNGIANYKNNLCKKL